MPQVFGQAGYDLRFDWGRKAVRDAVGRGDVIVIVDVLSFSTAVAAGVAAGARIYPVATRDQAHARAYAAKVRATLRTGDLAAPQGRRALSPLGYEVSEEGNAYVLCSPNGAACSTVATGSPAVFAGALVNATAVAEAAARAARRAGAATTVVACGERWTDAGEDEDVLRPALEDALGAGAILRAMRGAASPEARICSAGFAAAEAELEALLLACASGRELRERGHEEDVRFSARLDALAVAPCLRDGAYGSGLGIGP